MLLQTISYVTTEKLRMKDKRISLVIVVVLLASFQQFAVGQGKFATVKLFSVKPINYIIKGLWNVVLQHAYPSFSCFDNCLSK